MIYTILGLLVVAGVAIYFMSKDNNKKDNNSSYGGGYKGDNSRRSNELQEK